MKKIIIFIVICSLTNGLKAQQVVLPAGNSVVNANGSVSYSVGQIFTANVTDINGELNLGIQNPFDIYRLQGRFISPLAKPINNVVANVIGSTTPAFKSNALGNYTSNVSIGNFIIKPTKNNDIKKNNGVSSIDVILVQNHILNKAKLNSPYKLIAADVNNNKSISNIDVIFMKRLILGIDTTFTGNRLWAFVDSAYKFADTTNPFPYKDSISFSNITSNKTNQNFIGIKLGDVNYDWNPALAKGTKNDNVRLVYEVSKSSEVQNLYRIKVTTKNFKELLAMQYTLNFNHKDYEFIDFENNKLGIEFNATQANKNGNISFLWADVKGEEKTFEDGSEIFTLVLKSKMQVASSELANNLQLTINNSITEIEALDKDFNQHQIILSKSQAPTSHLPITTNEQWTVSPNPTNGDVVVSLISISNKIIVFELCNAQGKTLYTQIFEAIKGNNFFKLNLKKKTNLPSGLYFLKANGTIQRLVIH